jgi:HAE1 family hydrophobic/amphiphilic exporter-1
LSIARFSVRQVVLVNLLFFVCMLAGVIAYLRTPVDFFPDISFNTSVVVTVWTGASAEEVERLVTTKLENEIEDIDGMKAMRSTSAAGVSSVVVEWDETLSETEYESSLNDLRAAIDRVQSLPEDAEEPLLRELSVSEVFASVQISVTDTGGVGEKGLRRSALEVQERLEELPGVQKVTIRGEHDRELRVLVDRDAAAQYGLTVNEVVAAIRGTNLNLPAGSYSTEAGETTLRATGDYRSLEQVLATVVKRHPDGSLLRLSQIARLEDGIEKRRFLGRFNGMPALILGIAKQDAADVVELARRIDEWIAGSSGFLPAGIEISKTLDMSRYVTSRMSVLRNNLATGILLVMAILWFTIGFRNAALTIIAIPFSFLVALILFPIMGLTISAFSLVGMLLVSGMLVDDAIIVLENIYRRIEEGEAVREAVIRGTEEVMWPVIAAVATSCAAFAPLLLISGTAGEYFSIMPKTVIVCLIASLFECLVILPAHYLDLGSRRSPGELPERPAGASRLRLFFFGIALGAAMMHARVDRGLGALRRLYLRALDVVLLHKAPFSALIASCWLLSFAAGSWLPIDLFPREFDNFFVTLEAPTDYAITQTDRVTRGVEQNVIDGLLGGTAENYSTYVGSLVGGNHSQRSGPNLAMIYVTLTDTEQNRVHPERALLDVRERLERYRQAHPDGIEDLRLPTPRSGPPVGRPVAVRIQSDAYERAKTVSLEMQAWLRTVPGVFNVEDSMPEGPREIRLVLDEERAHRHDLRFRDLAQALRGANEGLVASSYRDPQSDEEHDIRVMLELKDRRDIAHLLQTEVHTPAGYLVLLGDVADVEMTRGRLSLAHYDGKRTVTVYADVDGQQATSTSVNRALEVEFADLSLRHPDASVTFGGEFQRTTEAFNDMLAAVPVAMLLVYMILAAVFRSYLQPVVVITAVPFAVTGMVFGLHLLGYSISIDLLYALIGLIGVVVNDSLVMVDFINRARERGMPLLDAVRISGAQRLRPILLTTLTTVLALLPMALGLVGASKTYGPFATGISFGLVFAMLGTLFCVPLAYTILIGALDWVRSTLVRVGLRRPAAADPTRA